MHRPTKFPWRMMCMNMDELRIIVEFFKRNVKKFRRGAHVLLERIEDFEAVNEPEEERKAEDDDSYPDNVADYKADLNDFEGGGGDEAVAPLVS